MMTGAGEQRARDLGDACSCRGSPCRSRSERSARWCAPRLRVRPGGGVGCRTQTHVGDEWAASCKPGMCMVGAGLGSGIPMCCITLAMSPLARVYMSRVSSMREPAARAQEIKASSTGARDQGQQHGRKRSRRAARLLRRESFSGSTPSRTSCSASHRRGSPQQHACDPHPRPQPHRRHTICSARCAPPPAPHKYAMHSACRPTRPRLSHPLPARHVFEEILHGVRGGSAVGYWCAAATAAVA